MTQEKSKLLHHNKVKCAICGIEEEEYKMVTEHDFNGNLLTSYHERCAYPKNFPYKVKVATIYPNGKKETEIKYWD